MTPIRWEDPPERLKGQGYEDHEAHELAAELRKNPGKWAVVYQYDQLYDGVQMAAIIRNGKKKAWQPRRAFEAKSVRIDKTTRCEVYARYIGEQ